MTAELEAMALAEPSSAAERELSEQLALEQKTKMALVRNGNGSCDEWNVANGMALIITCAQVAKQTDLLRKAADLSDQLDEHEDETRQLIESRQKAEADIREFKRKHKVTHCGLNDAGLNPFWRLLVL